LVVGGGIEKLRKISARFFLPALMLSKRGQTLNPILSAKPDFPYQQVSEKS
jgi:hypothetical protein